MQNTKGSVDKDEGPKDLSSGKLSLHTLREWTREEE